MLGGSVFGSMSVFMSLPVRTLTIFHTFFLDLGFPFKVNTDAEAYRGGFFLEVFDHHEEDSPG
jgi:hypothetical protein